ncbi:hypothetical protein A9Q99_03275 [Gammaproteobacteria bacterium 45_16_T64]|nr:hypothetical protein A9Q99_03275 [Gammaproteobacteria bacterium 45_16_T64]
MNTPNFPHVCDSTIEQRVIKQLIEALLFEKLVEYTYVNQLFNFSIGKTQCKATGYIGGFGRVRLEQNSITSTQHTEFCNTLSLESIIETLPCDDNKKKTFHEELRQTIKLCHWNKNHAEDLLSNQSSRRLQSYSELESSIDEGHPYHPSFKARTGFSEADHAAYGPETAQSFQLHWLAIKRIFLTHSLPLEDTTLTDKGFWQQELGHSVFDDLEQRLTLQGGDWKDYSLLPIHPWQWHHYKNTSLTPALNNSDILALGSAGDLYKASISVRTLLNVSRPEKAHIKLPLNMVNTSSIRNLDPHAVTSAPFISQWLSRIINDDPYFSYQAPMHILEEYAGITVASSILDKAPSPAWVHDLHGQLAVVFRKSPPSDYENRAVPFSALAVMENDGMPFIHPWIDRYGLKKWLTQLIRVVVLPVWHLLVHHGIAIEAHGQNIVLVHNEGWPETIVLRDFHDSVEYVKDYLAAPHLEPHFNEINTAYIDAPDNKYYWMTSEEALRELVIDTLFVFNISEIAHLLEREYQHPESDTWSEVIDQLSQYALNGCTALDRIAKVDPFNDVIQTESLLTLKLNPAQDAIVSHDIPNALAK